MRMEKAVIELDLRILPVSGSNSRMLNAHYPSIFKATHKFKDEIFVKKYSDKK